MGVGLQAPPFAAVDNSVEYCADVDRHSDIDPFDPEKSEKSLESIPDLAMTGFPYLIACQRRLEPLAFAA